MTTPKLPLFVAVQSAVMLGAQHVATACSSMMARQIAYALNAVKRRPKGQ